MLHFKKILLDEFSICRMMAFHGMCGSSQNGAAFLSTKLTPQ
jgi:hypothetical protein